MGPPMGAQPTPAAVVPATKVEVSVSCRSLLDKDVLSKSDPMCVLYMKSMGQESYHEVGRTEMLKNTLNPDFAKKFVLDYYFEELQKLQFRVYDVDSQNSSLDNQDYLGSMECTLGEIVGSSGGRLDKPLQGVGKNAGNIIVRAEEVSSCNDMVIMQIEGRKLDKKDFFGKSDPFLVFSRRNDDGSTTVVHRTEVIKKNLNPKWRSFNIRAKVLCNGDYDRSIVIECYDYDRDGSHDLIGASQTTLKELSTGSCQQFELINPKKKAKKSSYKNSGVLTVVQCKIEQEHTFLEFIKGGLQLNFTVAIDFTASNGDPRSPESLHYINSYQMNHYARALYAVGEIIQDYDSDKMFPALGFGARLPNGTVSHEFFLNGNPQNPYCAGISGVMDAYQRTLAAVQLYGPTNFAPVVNHVAKFASAYRDGSHYFVLLILTDGVITDMPQTLQSIVTASSLPMSIIIVGIGNAEFDAMEQLDSDDRMLSCNGKFAERDIVQFVPFRDFVGGRYGSNLAVSQAYLAKEVLAEVPDQVTGYMRKNGIKPRPPPALEAEPRGSSAPMW